MNRQESSFSELLLLYVWPTAIFEDATVGTREERWAKYRRNRERRVFLPHYGRVWLLLSLLLLGSGQAISEFALATKHLSAQIAAMLLFTGFTYALTVLVVVIVAYVWLTRNG